MCGGLLGTDFIINHTFRVKVIVGYFNHEVGSPANGALDTHIMTLFKPVGSH